MKKGEPVNVIDRNRKITKNWKSYSHERKTYLNDSKVMHLEIA